MELMSQMLTSQKRDVTQRWRHEGIATSDLLSAGGLQCKSDNRLEHHHLFARIQTGSIRLHEVYYEPHVHR